MKRSVWAALGLALAITGLGSTSSATTIPYSESYTPGTYLMDASGTEQQKALSWIFDIRDNLGWNIPGQVFNNGRITLYVRDDGGNGDGSDKATFAFEAGTGTTNANINASDWSGIFVVDSSAFADGLISATLTATVGDFYFERADLDVESNYTYIEPNTENPVPEPSTIFLLGAGLGGMAIWRRKRTA